MKDFLKKFFPYGLSFVLAWVLIGCAEHLSSPWCDELTFVDSGYNFIRTGCWWSNVFYCVNSPSFSLIAAFAMIVFGTSHTVVASVSCLSAVGASWIILWELERRRWLNTGGAMAFFIILFWSGWTFLALTLNGRPDTLTLLLVATLLGRMFPPGETVRPWRVLRWTIPLMLVSAYALPLVALIALGAWLKTRTFPAFWRGFNIILGGVIGFAVLGVFYYFNREAVRFLGFFATFNTITGGSDIPFVERLLDAYTYDSNALVLLALSFVLLWFADVPRFKTVGALLLTALVPLAMVAAGRYQPYYSWLLYVPSCALLAGIVARCRLSTLIVLICVFASSFAIRVIRGFELGRSAAEHREEVATFILSHTDVIERGQPVVVIDDTIGDVSSYYPLLEAEAEVWFRGALFLEEMSDREKFDVGLKRFIPENERRRRILDRAFDYQKIMPDLPEEGLVFSPSPRALAKVLPLLEKRGYELVEIDCENGLSLWNLTKL